MGGAFLTPAAEAQAAPPWVVRRWFNADTDVTVPALAGRVVVLHAFQMLCPGCVSHGLPQAQRVAKTMSDDDVAVIGLHTVFEHHDAMRDVSLEAFLHEYRIDFPVGVDQHDGSNRLPLTMQRYRFQGTPSLVLLDQRGYVRSHVFGRIDDLQLGSMLGSLVEEGDRARSSTAESVVVAASGSGCASGVCEVVP